MKVKLSPLINMSNRQQKEIQEYINNRVKQICDEDAEGLIRRCYKTFAVALHTKYGFGKKRLLELMGELSDISKLRNTDEVFWKHIDDIIVNEIGLAFNREKYDELDK